MDGMPQQLAAHGLTECGSWVRGDHGSVAHLRDVCAFGLSFDVPGEWKSRRDVVYAFVANGAVIYIGETSSGMGTRFANYRYGNSVPGDTDNRIKLAITQALLDGDTVAIWASQPVAELHLPSGVVLRMPASKPLEEHLIGLIQPQQNVKMRAATPPAP